MQYVFENDHPYKFLFFVGLHKQVEPFLPLGLGPAQDALPGHYKLSGDWYMHRVIVREGLEPESDPMVLEHKTWHIRYIGLFIIEWIGPHHIIKCNESIFFDVRTRNNV